MVSPKENCNKDKQKTRGRKRKRQSSVSSVECEEPLPENVLEMEKNLHASAIKNNLEEKSVRKILKKVVTNDRVLALVKLREEAEGSGTEDNKLLPKLTRAKVKELRRVSPKTTAWNLENMELTPINHIPVKTRPEVKALIAQELPEDEDDEEYKPTHDDVPSDDDQGLESVSDLESLSQIPSTPSSQVTCQVASDEPFKIPQNVSSALSTPQKLNPEEEATIALRTRSKLSLSATSIEHIESTFEPPDDIPMPQVDDLWNQFLNECLNPASNLTRHEDDDETDPEYNVAADPDANDEDEEALGNGIIKISKKELNDLVTELFNIMPEETVHEALMADKLDNSTLIEHRQTELSTHWDGKQEPISDDERRQSLSDRIAFEKKDYTRVSIGKSEPPDTPTQNSVNISRVRASEGDSHTISRVRESQGDSNTSKARKQKQLENMDVDDQDETTSGSNKLNPPPLLRLHLKQSSERECVTIEINESVCSVLPEQILILQQQLRQHIQFLTSNYLQLYIHPVHWSLAPIHKEHLKSLEKIGISNPSSVVNVCNLKPAVELLHTWETTVSADTPENKDMVQFMIEESDRSRRRYHNRSLYVGEFHHTLKELIANSSVFLYPHLLPPMPYRTDAIKKYAYTVSEDSLIALGLDQFWDYVSNNPDIYKVPKPSHPRQRRGLNFTVQLIVKHMFPWIPYKVMIAHVQSVRKTGGGEYPNPIYKFLEDRTITPVKHTILSFNPNITLYEHPEHEVPRLWVRHLSKNSKRFRKHLLRRTITTGIPPQGVEINMGEAAIETSKNPLPIDFTKQIISNRINLLSKVPTPTLSDKFDVQISNPTTVNSTHITIDGNTYKLVQTSNGAYLMPLTNEVNGPNEMGESDEELTATQQPTKSRRINLKKLDSNLSNKIDVHISNTIRTSQSASVHNPLDTSSTTNSNVGPITTPAEINKNNIKHKPTSNLKMLHCPCCVLLRKICKEKQTVITDYFNSSSHTKTCYCKNIKYPKVTKRLKILVNNYKCNSMSTLQCLDTKLRDLRKSQYMTALGEPDTPFDLDEFVFVTSFHLKLLTRLTVARDTLMKRRIHTILTRFNPDLHGVIQLTKKLSEAFSTELIDMYKEFMCFLTPEQADICDGFRDYFHRNCARDLIKKVEEQVLDKKVKIKMLDKIRKIFNNTLISACEICTELLSGLDRYPELARYVFSLFPHRKQNRAVFQTLQQEPSIDVEEQPQSSEIVSDDASNQCNVTMDYEADHSSSEDEESVRNNLPINDDGRNDNQPEVIKSEVIVADNETQQSTNPEVPVQQDSSDSSNASMTIVEEDAIKTETEWRRDEDKLILEVLKEHLTPKERKDKTIMEIIQEKNIIGMLTDSLNKTKSEVTSRVLYLLHILVVSEK